MTSQTKAKQAHALVSLFVSTWTDKYGKKPQINRFRERWGFESMIDDLGYERAREIIEFYFKTEKIGHPVDGLLYNYDSLNVTYDELREDENNRIELRRRTEQRVREWEKRYGQHRSPGN